MLSLISLQCDLEKPTCSTCRRLAIECEGYTLRLTWVPASVGTADNPRRPKRNSTARLSSSGLLDTPPTAASASHNESDQSQAIPAPFQLDDADTLYGGVPSDPSDGLAQVLAGPGSYKAGFSWLEDHESLFLHHFHRHVYKPLLLVLGDWFLSLSNEAPVRSALFALSASNLFQMHLFRPIQTSTLHATVTRSDSELTRSCYKHAIGYYDNSIQLLGQATADRDDCRLLTLATTLLLSLFEYESGSVGGSFIHMDGADAIVLSSNEMLQQTSTGRLLRQSWANMRARRNRLKLPFRPLQADLARVPRSPVGQLYRHTLQFSSGLSNPLTDAYTLRNRLVIQQYAAAEDINAKDALENFREWYSDVFEHTYVDVLGIDGRRTALSMAEVLEDIETTRERLQNWRSSLGEMDMPIIPSTSPLFTMTMSLGLEGNLMPLLPVVPMTFQTHEAAFEYLRYSTSLVLTSPQVLEAYLLATEAQPPQEQCPAVVAHVLGVIEGLDPAKQVHYDTYESGPLWMFVTLALCVPSSTVISYLLDTILPRFEKHMDCGPHLVHMTQARDLLLCIQSQTQAGVLPLICSANSVATADLISGQSIRFGDKYVIIGRDGSDSGSGGYLRTVVSRPHFL